MKGLDAALMNQSAPNKDKMQPITTGQTSIGEVNFLSDDEESTANDDKAASAGAIAQPTSYDQSD